MKISFTFTHDHIHKQRPRVTRRGTYTPKETVLAEKMLQAAWTAVARKYKLVIPTFVFKVGVGNPMLSLHIKAFIGIPKTRKKELKEGDRHLQKPDHDNITKLVSDALNCFAYEDDSCVWKSSIEKYWTSGPTRLEITLESE